MFAETVPSMLFVVLGSSKMSVSGTHTTFFAVDPHISQILQENLVSIKEKERERERFDEWIPI